jgi:hypothetical protein
VNIVPGITLLAILLLGAATVVAGGYLFLRLRRRGRA